jgi:hypothetical protein
VHQEDVVMLRIAMATLGLFLFLPATASAQVVACSVDNDCSDRVYCNGIERCQPGAPGADERGCIADPRRNACLAGQVCHEEPPRCETLTEDRDSDGHTSAATGGDDCNDNDGNEFPGNAERWDADDHDEDCDGSTHGFTPGFGTQSRTGTFQACSGQDLVVAQGTIGGGAVFSRRACDNGSVCVTQPTGDGFCLQPPPGYVAGPEIPAPEDQGLVFRRRQQAGGGTSAPAPMLRPVAPLQIARPVARPLVVPPAGSAPPLAAPSCDPPRMRDKSGACVLPPGQCPDGMYFNDKSQACEKK